MKFMLPMFSAAAILAMTASCSKSGEMNDLSKAQQCLDQVDQNNPQSAASCMAYVEKYEDQQADILKCSILMTSGGLVESKIVSAYNALKDNTVTNKAATFMALLALNLPDVAGGFQTAQTANVYCQASGVPGLMYISTIIVGGSAFNASVGGTGVDPNNPAAAINNLITQCSSASPPANCTTNLPVLGQTAITLAGAYCTTASASQDVCSQVNGAVSSAGGDPATVGQALYCYFNKQTYNPTTKLCE